MEKYSIREENMARDFMHKLTIKIVEELVIWETRKKPNLFHLLF